MGPLEEDPALKTALCFSGLAVRAAAPPEAGAFFSRRALDRVGPLAEEAFGSLSQWFPALTGGEHTDPSHHAALYIYGLASYETWTESNTVPVAIAGYSLGVYVSLVVSGALDPADGLSLVLNAGRGILEGQASLGHGLVAVGGLAVGRAPDLLARLPRPDAAAVTHVNTPENFILTYPREAVDSLCETALSFGAQTAAFVPFPGASHSRFMEPWLGDYFRTLENVEFRPPSIPLYSCVTTGPVRTAGEARDLAREQLIRPVLLSGTVEKMSGLRPDRIVVVGVCEGLPALLAYLNPDVEVRLFPGGREDGHE